MSDARCKRKGEIDICRVAACAFIFSFIFPTFCISRSSNPIRRRKERKKDRRKERNKDCARENWKEMRRAEITSGRGAGGHLAKKEAHEDMIPKE